MVNTTNLTESERIRLGYEESKIDIDRLQECEGAPYCVECAEVQIVVQAEQMLYGSPLCWECFTEFHG